MIKLDTKILYFGASNPNIKEISEGKFLTSFKSIACCFAIDLNDVYGELNKKYTSISAIKIDTTKTYYVHLLQPKKIMNNKEVSQYVPDAIAIGECWILDDEIKSTVIGKIEIGSLLPYVYTFLKDNNKFFRCVTYHDYDFIPFESKFNRIYRKILNQK